MFGRNIPGYKLKVFINGNVRYLEAWVTQLDCALSPWPMSNMKENKVRDKNLQDVLSLIGEDTGMIISYRWGQPRQCYVA